MRAQWLPTVCLALSALAHCNSTTPGTGFPSDDTGLPSQDATDAPREVSAPDTGPPTGDQGGSDLGAMDTPPTDTGTPPDAPREDTSPADTALDVPPADVPATWPARSCELTLRYRAPGARTVVLAGDFTDWARSPLPMTDADGDGTFEVTLRPGDRLAPGSLHPYKVVVDGTWNLDPNSTHRRYDGDCVNSAFLVPACSLRPEVGVEPFTPSWDAVTSRARATVRFRVLSATDGAPPGSVTVTVDGRAPAPSSLTADAGTGVYTLNVTGLERGRHLVSVRATDGRGRAADPVDLPVWAEAERFEWRDAMMYMLVVDRFANGQRSNDAPVGAPVERAADFHGGDLQGALAVMQSGYFEDLGVRVIWLSPINQQATGHFQGREDTRRYAGYHGYWPTRGRAVEPRFGGNEALRAFVDEAHRRGIRVVLDLINNQVHDQHEYVTAHPTWFRRGCVCGIDAGCGWSERPLDCLFAGYLPDINWRVPEAEEQFVADAVHWVAEYGVDGFRIDAVKHVETNSIFNLRAALSTRFEQGGERLLLEGETAVTQGDAVDYGCGERYGDGYGWIDAYTGANGLDGQFDFPTHHRMQSGMMDGSLSYTDLERIVRDAETRYRATGLHVRFLGTHDSSRMASRAARDAAQDCRWPGGGSCASLPRDITDPEAFNRLRRAFTVLMTLPGIPFLYYGDEIALPGGNDPDSRRDMAWTGALSSVSMGATSVGAPQESLRAWLRALGRARASTPALRRGQRYPLVSERDLYVYAWATASSPSSVALVVVNKGEAVRARTISAGAVPGFTSVRRWEALVGTGEATPSGDGAALTLGAGESAVFVAR